MNIIARPVIGGNGTEDEAGREADVRSSEDRAEAEPVKFHNS